MNWNLRGGVIIIGSLLWQNYLRKQNNTIRLDWRNSQVDIENKIPVRVPIRYGRISDGNIMTMVFSNRMAKRNGFGYVVPFKKNINNLDDLLCECLALSKAEGMGENFVKNWGVLAYLLNDSIIEKNIKKEIINFFRRHKNAEFDILKYKVGRERSCITKSLKLNINWVMPTFNRDKSKIDDFHFLLATPTMPLDNVPTYEEIADTIRSDKKRNYFINNFTNGIITYDDFKIIKYL